MPPVLSDDVWVQIGLHLKPRHLFKLMCTNKRVKLLVDNEVYWTRVAAHLLLRDHWMLESHAPHERGFGSEACLPPFESKHYYMVGLDQGYFRAMEYFMHRIEASIEAYSLLGDQHDLAYITRIRESGKGLGLEGLVHARKPGKHVLTTDTMKELARYETISFWKTGKQEHIGESWPNIQKFLCQLEDDPMPAKYKRHVFRSMWEAFGEGMMLYSNGKKPFIGTDLCIF